MEHTTTTTTDPIDLTDDPVPKREPLATNWCFTQHFTQDAIARLAEKECFDYFKSVFQLWDSMGMFKWCIFELEHGDAEGRPHIQGYFKLHQRKRLHDLLRTWPRSGALLSHPKLLVAKGDDKSNWDYVGKEQNWTGDHFVEWGTRPVFQTNGERERTRWASARKAAQTAQLDDVPDDIFVMYYGNLSKIAANYKRAKIMNCSRGELPQHFKWIYGPPGSGKTTFVHDKVARDGASLYLKDCLTKWWDGFHGQEYTLLDDFPREGAEHMLNRFKQWCQQFPFPGETKGGLQQMRPENIYVTSNYHPREIWATAEERDLEAFEQRFEIVYLGPAGGEWKPRATAVGFTTPSPITRSVSVMPPGAPKRPVSEQQEFQRAIDWYVAWIQPNWTKGEAVGSDEIEEAYEFFKSGAHFCTYHDKRFTAAFKKPGATADAIAIAASPASGPDLTIATQAMVTESQLEEEEEE